MTVRADVAAYMERTNANSGEWSEADWHLRKLWNVANDENTAFEKLAMMLRGSRIRDGTNEGIVSRASALQNLRAGRVDVSGYPAVQSPEWKAAVTAARLSSLERMVGRLTARFCELHENALVGFNDNVFLVEGLMATADLSDPPAGSWPDMRAEAEKFLRDELGKGREL
jgi:hypothetical protein